MPLREEPLMLAVPTLWWHKELMQAAEMGLTQKEAVEGVQASE